MTEKLRHFTINLTPVVRHDQMEGKDYLVVPMVMLTEGVHQGTSGPLYYPKDELSKIPAIWNHKPVVVYHPQINGQGVSACDPDILTTYKIGVIMNTVYENGKLKAEAWLDPDRVSVVDERVMKAIEDNVMMELSTGLFTDLRDEEGDWNDEHYNAVAINYRPDHLAILPDQIGACSLADGAGFLRMNSETKTVSFDCSSFSPQAYNYMTDNTSVYGEAWNHWSGVFIKNELAHGEIREKLRALLDKGTEWVYIEDVFDDYFIYEKDEILYKQGYSIENDSVSLSGLSMQVTKVVEYKEQVIVNSRKVKTMDKKKFVADLIANESTQWEEADTETLMAMDEKVLEKMTPVANEVTEEETPTEETTEETSVVDNKEKKELTVNEYIAQAPEGLRDVLRNGLDTYNAEKQTLISKLTANKKCLFTKEQLSKKDNKELKALVTLAAGEKKEVKPDYSGNADPVDNTDHTEEPLPALAMSFGE